MYDVSVGPVFICFKTRKRAHTLCGVLACFSGRTRQPYQTMQRDMFPTCEKRHGLAKFRSKGGGGGGCDQSGRFQNLTHESQPKLRRCDSAVAAANEKNVRVIVGATKFVPCTAVKPQK